MSEASPARQSEVRGPPYDDLALLVFSSLSLSLCGLLVSAACRSLSHAHARSIVRDICSHVLDPPCPTESG